MGAETRFTAKVLMAREETIEVSGITSEDAGDQAAATPGVIAVLDVRWIDPEDSDDGSNA